MLCLPARGKLSHNLRSSGLGLWGVVALMGLHIWREDRQLGGGRWDKRVKRSQMGMLKRTFFEQFRLKTVCVCTGNDGRCCDPPPGSLSHSKKGDCEAISRAAAIYKMTRACKGSQRFDLFSLWWIFTVEGRVKVPSKKVWSVIGEASLLRVMLRLGAALHNPTAQYATNIAICLDFQAVTLRLLVYTSSPSSSSRIAHFRYLATKWTERERCHFSDPGVARHAQPLSLTIPRAKRDIISRHRASIALYWSQNSSKRYQQLGIYANIGSSPELKSLIRYALGRLTTRSGHGDFADYNHRFHHSDARLICACGLEKSPDRSFFCQLNRNRSRLCSGNITTAQARTLAPQTLTYIGYGSD
ncbi:hypothetical protein/putative reverse transcriptase [Blumeria hordei DH14]|uniref:Uncharacterized protein n=1 Tax=Blumeria graminis f. sp. hordei (strain DH14) TaxID=546991 RepID=N1JBX8_BLUG1|nr:hypothetical protein/putative reverse transcriptase [Blumeria hordei DH14]